MVKNVFANLKEVSKNIINDDKKLTLMYAFNATGKTRLSMTFKEQLNPPKENIDYVGLGNKRVLYFNSFTEDLFTWENDLDNDEQRYLMYKTNTAFGKYIYEQSVDQRINKKFGTLVNSDIFVKFERIENTDNMGIKFSRGDRVIKVSRGEERLFTWCVFMIIAENIVSDLKEDKDNEDINSIEYIYIDDPVSSLDENYTIAAALDLADLVKESVLQTEKEKKEGKSLKFVISTHHALFFEVLSNRFKKMNSKTVNILEKNIDDAEGYVIKGANNSPFSYHNYIFKKINDTNYTDLSKYHFNLMRNLLEKTALFLGYSDYQTLIPEESNDRSKFLKLLNEYSHGTHPDSESYMLRNDEKNLFREKFKEFKETYHWHLQK
ncbi:AAA family ATPase [Leuconostoc suionicum]|uniref:AAA family ATPase n=1 Tax=Leuconostoc suionicum TaxID=1511761 RepID=UPI00233EDE50|nr:AAA family ATPase [Leuconostoc suionicum]MDC2805112.1 AAA family ATPase [Leuconostoc suionicum]MDC2822624.1 AAA family ATPase [Leuconostoc suionicum]